MSLSSLFSLPSGPPRKGLLRAALLFCCVAVLWPVAASSALGQTLPGNKTAAAEMSGAACPDAELARTLDQLPAVYARRRTSLFRCSILASELAEAGVSPAALPAFLDPALFARLTDGDPDNGEFFAIGVGRDNMARLTVEVPACAAYQGQPPDRNLRRGVSLYYSDILLEPDVAETLCREDQQWCSGCR